MKRRSFLGAIAAAFAARKLPLPAPEPSPVTDLEIVRVITRIKMDPGLAAKLARTSFTGRPWVYALKDTPPT